MSYHKDPEVNDAFIRLLGALCEYERDTSLGSTLLFIPHEREDDLVMAQDGKPLPNESITPEELFRLAMRYYRPEADAEALNKAISAHPQAVILLEEKFPLLEVDQIAVLEEEFVNKGRRFPAYLMRKVLDHIKPSWRDEHPQYKKMQTSPIEPCPGDCDVCYAQNCLERRCPPKE